VSDIGLPRYEWQCKQAEVVVVFLLMFDFLKRMAVLLPSVTVSQFSHITKNVLNECCEVRTRVPVLEGRVCAELINGSFYGLARKVRGVAEKSIRPNGKGQWATAKGQGANAVLA